LRRLTLLLLILASISQLAPLNAQSAVAPAGVALALPVIEPGLTANAALAVDLTLGVQLYSHNADTPLPPASTAKLVTALVAERVLPRTELIVVTEQDLVPEEYSKMGLQAGDEVSVEALLYGTLVASGGDAAKALARVAGDRLEPGTPDPTGRFVQEMNAEAAALGMTGSRFVEPVGEDSSEQVVTARDLVRAAQAVLDDWLLARIVATPWISLAVAGPNARDLVLENTNQMVLYDGAVGVKTGTTDLAGECLVAAIHRGDNLIITVVLGSADRYADMHALLDALDVTLRWVALGAGASSAGARDELAAQGYMMPIRRTVLMTPEQADALRYEVQFADASSAAGRQGTVTFFVGEREVARLPVFTDQ
jgi:D-alanyl-D-alanine carboxypeptidase (penicillin-binding protein 5/6)